MKETPNHKIRYPEKTDNNAYVSDLTHVAEDVERELDDIGTDQLTVPGGAGDKGKLLVVDNTGAAAFQAMKGDATIAADGTISIGDGKVSTKHLADGLLTTVKYGDKSISLAKLVEALNLTDAYIAAANKDGSAGTPSLRTLGTGAKQAAAGNDARLSDERVPKDGSGTSPKLKPTAGFVAATANLALATSFTDVPGASLTLTPTVPSKLIVTTFAELEEAGPSGTTSLAHPQSTLSVDGVDEARRGIVEVGHTGASSAFVPIVRGVATQGYVVSLSAAEHTIKLRARRQEASGTCYAAGSGFQYLLVAA